MPSCTFSCFTTDFLAPLCPFPVLRPCILPCPSLTKSASSLHPPYSRHVPGQAGAIHPPKSIGACGTEWEFCPKARFSGWGAINPPPPTPPHRLGEQPAGPSARVRHHSAPTRPAAFGRTTLLLTRSHHLMDSGSQRFLDLQRKDVLSVVVLLQLPLPLLPKQTHRAKEDARRAPGEVLKHLRPLLPRQTDRRVLFFFLNRRFTC